MPKEDVVVVAMKEDVASAQDEVYAKVMDDTIVRGVIIDLTNTGVIDKTPEASDAAIADEVEHNIIDPPSKQSTTSNETTSGDKGELNVIILYSTSSGPTLLNYAQPATISKDQVQDMIGQAMEFFVERQHQENEQFRLSIQNEITIQSSNLGVVLSKTYNRLRCLCLELLL